MNVYVIFVAIEESVITKMTDIPIPTAILIFLNCKKNGHIPRNLVKIKLFTRTVEINIVNNSIFLPHKLTTLSACNNDSAIV